MRTSDNSSLRGGDNNDSFDERSSEGGTYCAHPFPSVLSILAPAVDEHLHVEIPIALCKYDLSGFYVTYLMRFVDIRSRWRWHCTRRYSEFRAFNRLVGRHIIPSFFSLSRETVAFPPLILSARSNREKNLIENRRQRLEHYMQKVLQESASLARNLGRKKTFLGIRLTNEKTKMERFGKLLAFIDHPHTYKGALLREHQHSDDRELLSVPSNAWECSSVASERVGVAREGISEDFMAPAGGTARPPPPRVDSTYWAPPPALPGPRLGLSLPSACVTQNLRGEWHTVITAARGDRRVKLRYIHDQVVAITEAMSMAKDSVVFDVAECKKFLVNFRVEHPISAYMRLEEDLEEISQFSRRSASAGRRVFNSPTTVANYRSNKISVAGNKHVTECIPIPKPVDEDVAYESQPQSSRVLHVRSSPSLASLQSQRERQVLSASRGLYSSTSCSRIESRRDEACQHFTLRHDWATFSPSHNSGDDFQALQTCDESEGVPWKFLNTFDKSNAVGSDSTLYFDGLRGVPVENCFCTDRSFCTSGEGDVYRTKCGAIIIVCPP